MIRILRRASVIPRSNRTFATKTDIEVSKEPEEGFNEQLKKYGYDLSPD